MFALALGLSGLLFGVVAWAATGDLTQKADPDGCITDSGSSIFGCTTGKALDGAGSVTVSPDGKSAYVASFASGAVAIFDRDPTTGKLTQKADGCITNEPTSGCFTGKALVGPSSVTVSPDGTSAYVASADSDAIAIFDRDPNTGKLTQKADPDGCITNSATTGCTTGKALDGPRSVTVSPDGKSAYVASNAIGAVGNGSGAVAIFDRDPTTGKLTQKADPGGCITISTTAGCTTGKALDRADSVTVSPDGKSAYVASYFSDAVAIFDRDPNTGKLTQKADPDGCITNSATTGCATGKALKSATSVTVSPDGTSVYVASAISGAVAIFDRDPTTGKLTQKADPGGCITNSATAGCTTGKALDGAGSVTVSPDGKSAYVASYASGAVVIFDRDPTTGKLTQKADGCITNEPTSGCFTGKALVGPSSVTVSPDGTSVYVASAISGAVAIFDRNDGNLSGSAKAKKKQKQKGKKIVVAVKVKAGEDLDAEATGSVKVKKKSYKLKKQTKSVSSGKSATLKLKPKKSKDAKKIAKALKKGKKAKAKLTVTMADSLGNKKSKKLSVKLKR